MPTGKGGKEQKIDESYIITDLIRALNICGGLNRASLWTNKLQNNTGSEDLILVADRGQAGGWGGWHNSPR